MNASESVECRLNRIAYLAPSLVVLFLTSADLAVASNPLNPPGPAPAFILVAESGIFALCLWATLYIARFRVIADAQGLTWRTVLGEKQVSWPQVRHYYQFRSADNLVVETDAGNLNISLLTTNLPQLQSFIQTHALSAHARDWRLKEAHQQAGEFRAFRYTYSNAGGFPFHLLLALGVGPLLFSLGPTNNLINPFTHYASLSGPTAWGSILGISIAIVLFFLPRLWESWNADQIVYRCRKETLEVNGDGIRWTDGNRIVTIPWADITEIRLHQAPLLLRNLNTWAIVTRAECVTFAPGLIKNGALLVNMIRSHVPATGVTWNPSAPWPASRLNKPANADAQCC